MSELLEGDYRGTPILIIRVTPQDRFPFQFTARKARMIVEHYEAIKAFAEKWTEQKMEAEYKRLEKEEKIRISEALR